VTLHHWQIASW